MRLLLISCFVVCAALVAGIRYWENGGEAAIKAQAQGDEKVSSVKKTSFYERTVHIPAAKNNQYYVEAKVNSRRTKFLVDTGAVFVALRESDLQKAGVLLKESDFKHEVSTANGVTNAARIKLDEIEIDSINIGNVEAFVLPDNRLDINLLGMSFLSELSSVETRGGEMILKQ